MEPRQIFAAEKGASSWRTVKYKPHIEHHVKRADDAWLCRDYDGLEARVEITSIGCIVELADVYDGVQFLSIQD
jgi:hypothetical protein